MSGVPPRSPASSRFGDAVLAACRAIVAVLAQLVPRDRRADWEAEWHGELWELVRRAERVPQRYGSAPRAALRFTLGALPHALHEWKEGWTMELLLKDLRYAIRSVARNRGFALTATLLIAVGVGANTTVFTLVAAVLFRPPAGVVDANRVVQIGRGAMPQGFDNWSQGQEIATALGSDTELPDAPLELTGPGSESGTYDSFIELALADATEARGQEEGTARTDYASSADDNTIISNVEASETSLGWVGFAYAEEAGDGVREIPIAAEPGGDCVEPSADTIADESYPLSRPLFIYVNNAKVTENQAVSPFVTFYLENLTEFVEGGGYVPMPEDQVEETTSTWEGVSA